MLSNNAHSEDDRGLARALDEAIARTVAIAALAAIALIHVLQLPGAFSDAGYLGALFVGAIVASVLLAAALAVDGDQRFVEAAGALAGLILIGYLVSRTTGLPAATDDVGEWAEPLGLASMVVEGLLVCMAAGMPATRRRPGGHALGRAVERDPQIPTIHRGAITG